MELAFHPFHVEDPVQMVALVEDAAGQKAVSLDGLFLHVLIEGLCLHMLRPGYLAVLSGYA